MQDRRKLALTSGHFPRVKLPTPSAAPSTSTPSAWSPASLPYLSLPTAAAPLPQPLYLAPGCLFFWTWESGLTFTPGSHPRGRLAMCTGKCSRFLGLSLIPLSLVCMVANALLLVPQGKTDWTDTSHLSLQVLLMGGFLGGGLMVSGLGTPRRGPERRQRGRGRGGVAVAWAGTCPLEPPMLPPATERL